MADRLGVALSTAEDISACLQGKITREHDYSLRRKFGVDSKRYDEILDAQGGVCAICGKEPRQGKRAFSVDHDHVSLCVRGILCHNCNTGLGHFRDQSALLRKAADYLDRGPTECPKLTPAMARQKRLALAAKRRAERLAWRAIA